jgi:hypothetical protein
MNEGEVGAPPGEQAAVDAARTAAPRTDAPGAADRSFAVVPTGIVKWLCDIRDKIANFFKPLDGRTAEVEPQGQVAEDLDRLTNQLTALEPG